MPLLPPHASGVHGEEALGLSLSRTPSLILESSGHSQPGFLPTSPELSREVAGAETPATPAVAVCAQGLG